MTVPATPGPTLQWIARAVFRATLVALVGLGGIFGLMFRFKVEVDVRVTGKKWMRFI